MNVLIHYKELIKIYNVIWNKISNLLKKEFSSMTVYDQKYINKR